MPSKVITSWFPQFGKDGDFIKCEGWDVVLKQLFTVLVTVPGTRQWNPEFGCHLTDRLFDIDINESDFSNEIRNALTKWIPYIKVNNVSVSINKMNERSGNYALINIDISYKNETKKVEFQVPYRMDLLQGSIYNIKAKRL